MTTEHREESECILVARPREVFPCNVDAHQSDKEKQARDLQEPPARPLARSRQSVLSTTSSAGSEIPGAPSTNPAGLHSDTEGLCWVQL
jgi:hypothetical protein